MSDGGAQHISFGPFVTSAGVLYPSIKVYHYAAGTSNDKTAWSDEDKQTAVAQPFIGDDTGVARFFADGDYKFVIKDENDVDLDNPISWDAVKVTSDTATMWEGNFGTSYPSAAAANRWQLFAKVTAGNVFQELGINDGTAFRTIATQSTIKNVLSFGAIGDGTTDDTAAIQAAIDDLSSGGIVYFPIGQYLVTSYLTFPSGATFLGEGRALGSYIKGNNLTSAIFKSDDQAASRTFVNFENLYIDNQSIQAGSIGIDLKNVSVATCMNVRIANVAIGVYGETDGQSCYYNDFYSTLMQTCTTGFHLAAGANDWRIFGGKMDTLTTGFIIVGAGNKIYGTSIEAFTSKGIHVQANGGVSIDTPRLETTSTATGIEIDSGSNEVLILNPRYVGANLTRLVNNGTANLVMALSHQTYATVGSNNFWLGESTQLSGNTAVRHQARNFAIIKYGENSGGTKTALYNKRFDFDDNAAAFASTDISSKFFTAAATNAGAVTIQEQWASVKFLTDSGNDDSASLIYKQDLFDISTNPKAEFYIRVDNIDHVYMFVGFASAAMTNKDTMPTTYAGIEFDSDVDAANLYMVTDNAGAGEVKLDTAVDLVAQTFIKVFIDLTDSSNPKFYINDVEVTGAFTGTVPTSGVVYPYVHVQALSAATDLAYLVYEEFWQDIIV